MSSYLLLGIAACAMSAPVEAPLPTAAVVAQHLARFRVGHSERVVVVGVTTRHGRAVWSVGEVDGRPADGRTLFEIGSLTKSFTGLLLADMVRSGTVALDDPLGQHLPADWQTPTRDGRQITLLHLATHTSSLPRMPPGILALNLLTGSLDNPYAHYTEGNLKWTLAHVALVQPIGSEFAYSNLGFGTLGVALTHAADAPDLPTLFEQHLLRPLDLSDTTFAPTPRQRQRLAPPHRAAGEATAEWTFDALTACGGLRSTTGDLLTYAEAALDRRPTSLRPAFHTAMQPWRQTCEGQRFAGLGWFVQPWPLETGGTTPMVWHGGGTGGYRAFLALLPERDIGIVILSSSDADIDPQLTGPLLRQLLRP